MKVFARILSVVTLCVSCAFSETDQKFEVPVPTGSYAVGTTFYYFIDKNRPNLHTNDPEDYREISVQAWYPAEPKAEELPMHYDRKENGEEIVKIGFVSPSFIEEVALAPSYSYMNAALANGIHPVILFSASAAINGNSLLFEELASHGYIVFRLGHPHWCDNYFDADGRIFFRDKENDSYNKRMWAEENSEVVHRLKDRITRATTVLEKLSLQEKLNENMPMEKNDVRLWVEDIGFVIDELEGINRSGNFFKGKLDLSNIGVIGYSKGGVAAGQACISEKRCKAGVNLSGFMFGDVAVRGLTVPFMNMEGIETWSNSDLSINESLFHNSKSSIYMVQVDGASHASFTNVPAWKEYVRDDFKGILGTIDGRRVLKIQNDYVLQFFNRHLKGMKAPLLENSSEVYPGVRFKYKHPQS